MLDKEITRPTVITPIKTTLERRKALSIITGGSSSENYHANVPGIRHDTHQVSMMIAFSTLSITPSRITSAADYLEKDKKLPTKIKAPISH